MQQTTDVWAEHQVFLETQPSFINIKVFQNQLKNLAPFTIQMMSDRNLTNVTVSFTDLRSDEIGGAWIPEKALAVSPNPLNLTAGKLADVNLSLTKLNQTGLFHGFMTIYSSEGVLRTIPVDIDILPVLCTS
ncbi:MAG TPA: hypothetical protein VEL11_17540 [Candidatus Bathyarchaeia archaeon]|nr:hypothetical protein [Candidatus Bathyarchaeia archaeon]